MFISRVKSKGKNGREYVSVLLRQSTRVGKKVVSKTLAILTGLPEWLLACGETQLGFFDNVVHETTLEDGRRLVTRCNPDRRTEIEIARKGFETRLRAWATEATAYLQTHPRALEATQLKGGLLRQARCAAPVGR